ncbi:MAG: hypothetical protein JW891_07870 [Candidatus Lokiarchaeota archaeon]|nr:hypothetical protein [Candidatus Lokiarchaeota archaeon]
MESFHDSMVEYRSQLKKGKIQRAYRGLMDYYGSLRSHFQKNHPEHAVPGNTYFGYMDMTYFAVNPLLLKARKLRIAIVFLHEEFRFEAWLGAYNKTIQKEYWDLVRQKSWDKYRVPSSLEGVDSIVECNLVENPDFRDLEALTTQIETGTMRFVKDVEDFLSKLI